MVMNKILSDRFVFSGEPIVMGFAVGQIFYYQDILTREFEFMNIKEHQVEGGNSKVKKCHRQGPS